MNLDDLIQKRFQAFSEFSQIHWGIEKHCYWWAYQFVFMYMACLLCWLGIYWFVEPNSISTFIISVVGAWLVRFQYRTLPERRRLSKAVSPQKAALKFVSNPATRLLLICLGAANILYMLSDSLLEQELDAALAGVVFLEVIAEYFLLCLPLPPDAVARRQQARTPALPQGV